MGGNSRPVRSRAHARRGFTLVELMIAGLIAAFIAGSVAVSMSQLGRARDVSKRRFDAYLRADAALHAIRKEVASVLRSDDLFYTRLLLIDETLRAGRNETFDRDEILLFNTRVKPLRNIDFNGEGFEYETQFRVMDDDYGPVLWRRSDPMPDEFPLAGGIAEPMVEGILSLMMQAYDGDQWHDEWDSDILGLPRAISVAVLASGHRGPDDIYEAPRAVLRTIISIDRVLPPKDQFKDPQEDESLEGEVPSQDGGLGAGGTSTGGGTAGGDSGARSGGRPGSSVGGGGGGRPGGGAGSGGGGGRPGSGIGGGGGGSGSSGISGGGSRPRRGG